MKNLVQTMNDNFSSVISLESSVSRIYGDKNCKFKGNVFINTAPKGLKKEFNELFTKNAIEFMVELVIHFEKRIEGLYNERLRKKAEFKNNPTIPKFKKVEGIEEDWKISPVCDRLKNRHLDLGDVSSSNIIHFTSALQSDVQGIQVDFDDGHCPTWSNQISGLHNVLLAVHSRLPPIKIISKCPILMLRPRAWNMIESNMSINGRQVPGPLFDFSLLIFHNGSILQSLGSGPAFYLSKLESSEEAKLWNDIFSWTEKKLKLPHGSIKACVLIENILASFEMENILFELREHSLGLNCGIWDYSASIISKFGTEKSFLLPDRNKYVNMNRRFLKKYMELVVTTCHKRGAHATGGMAARLLPKNINSQEFSIVLQQISEAKLIEIHSGVDGFMVYDCKLVPHMNSLWREYGGPLQNRITYPGASSSSQITAEDLLSLPKGGVTLQGLDHNIRVSILFIWNWLNGRGHFVLDNSVEDSATAEISRSQIWQWIRHAAEIEDSEEIVTRNLIKYRSQAILQEICTNYENNPKEIEKFITAYDLFHDLVNRLDSPEFITSFIYNEYSFKKVDAHL